MSAFLASMILGATGALLVYRRRSVIPVISSETIGYRADRCRDPAPIDILEGLTEIREIETITAIVRDNQGRLPMRLHLAGLRQSCRRR